ncbi:tRNA (adenosine(37)-N6)-threonylcarbamoyltransferase complex ATPase subunit type 1 TsaE [Eubacterium pyruvativorans]|uniref:tRNA (adenosine(37)-N6)-threonylcarbamoyltransferase complex ATPase subunit type 1 TsaE n=1 Tax=Eubacterium pyruvativorans TaxID=155865 RepID=UPI0008810A0C|nr:tRNA (adenosine(37)-N6)-threonylcarbamoyltransferase complex ATPase subunit type 1 TsaE [Eubacterium pyruvativorans]MCI5746232.1 tRNA (adenosine(37)-N6)-threonylcarbamoyltransferase complex ATPase subunit type 1 TsaE [Eubacterium pyruvativorans]MDD7685021.1 tRNA (adenosine(37)-N6)-threonylcarbamoyltransferase complex ATPase subunit type 1 TsaE [Eubacterium pyruvativorans]MDY4049607.1 tRNA (adenosine(37)-N6)-threonylcarbamoyltransferase complex ATPase subunit type 1 TsaE [Eubacterium pyruvativ
MREIRIRNEEDTKAFGRKLAEELEAGDILALIGDLGTGKTTLTKSVAAGLGVTEDITSPTFNIVNEYHSGRLPLYHFDVYRLESGADLFEIGGEEYFDAGGVCIIEWADLVAEALPDDTKVIFLEYGAQEGERIYRCTF